MRAYGVEGAPKFPPAPYWGPRLDSEHAKCEGVSIRLRFSVSAPLSAVPLTNMYFGTFLKNYYPDSFEIFSVFRGHRCHRNVKILRESDEGIFRGEGGKKNFRPPISPLRGVMGAPNFYTR